MKGSIPRTFIDDLLAKTDIVELVNSRVKLKKAGRDYQACCPFHHEKTPSFTVSQKKQFYHCFGCGAHGNAISFLMEYDKLEFVEAIEELAGMLGLEIPRENKPHFHGKQINLQTKRNLYELMQEIAQFYQQQLAQHIPAQSYLQQRGLSPEVISRFQIGFVPNSFDAVLQRFGQQKEINKNSSILVCFPVASKARFTIASVIGLCSRFAIDVAEPLRLADACLVMKNLNI